MSLESPGPLNSNFSSSGNGCRFSFCDMEEEVEQKKKKKKKQDNNRLSWTTWKSYTNLTDHT